MIDNLFIECLWNYVQNTHFFSWNFSQFRLSLLSDSVVINTIWQILYAIIKCDLIWEHKDKGFHTSCHSRSQAWLLCRAWSERVWANSHMWEPKELICYRMRSLSLVQSTICFLLPWNSSGRHLLFCQSAFLNGKVSSVPRPWIAK